MNRRALVGVALVAGVLVVAAAALSTTGLSGLVGVGDDPSTVDVDDEGPLELLASADATVTGTVDAPAGSEVIVRIRSTSGENPFLVSNASTVDEDGRFVATLDLSGIETEREATLRVTSDGDDVERTVVIEPAERA